MAAQLSPVDEAATALDLTREFDRQVDTLLDRGYPAIGGMSASAFVARVAPLRRHVVARLAELRPPSVGRAPFVLVVTKAVAPAERTMPLAAVDGRPGFVSADTADAHRFEPVAAVRLPDPQVYLALDVQRGDEYLNWSPDEAVPAIVARDRTPLTVDEGIAFLTHFPGSLQPNHCFMLNGSRCGDRRVPALWLSGGTGRDGKDRRGAPKLGWCWAGNRHTWLGHGSCAERVGPAD